MGQVRLEDARRVIAAAESRALEIGQAMSIAVADEGGNIVALNNAVANTLAFQTGAQLIGGGLEFYSNAAGTKWFVSDLSAGNIAITVS